MQTRVSFIVHVNINFRMFRNVTLIVLHFYSEQEVVGASRQAAPRGVLITRYRTTTSLSRVFICRKK